MRNSYANISSPNPANHTNTMDFYEYGDIRFFTGDMIDSTNSKERMRITSSGNVGIGTDSPDAKLHVQGGHLYLYGNTISGTNEKWQKVLKMLKFI